MGRTLHYEFKPKNGKFTAKELEKLYDVGQIYFERCEWTCETFDIRPYGIYPNWDRKSTWDKLSARWNELAQEGLHPNKISQVLVKEGIAYFHRDKPEYGFYGFTKVGGNELNALQVTMGLIAASRTVKNAVITLHDEGKFLKCHLIIRAGLAMPDADAISSQIGYLLSKALFDDGYAGYKESFVENAKELYDTKESHQEGWCSETPKYDIAEFCRPIKAEDFENHPEYGASEIMAGFNGEYFGLSTVDAEAESYRMIASIQKLLPKDVKIDVAPKIHK